MLQTKAPAKTTHLLQGYTAGIVESPEYGALQMQAQFHVRVDEDDSWLCRFYDPINPFYGFTLSGKDAEGAAFYRDMVRGLSTMTSEPIEPEIIPGSE